MIDISSIEFAQNPYPFYDLLRKEGPVHFLPHLQRWLVTGYQEVIDILGDAETYSSAVNASFDAVLLGADPPEHTTYRRLLDGAKGPFSKQKVLAMEVRMRDMCEGLLDVLKGHERFDLIADYAAHLSSLTIMDILGISPSNNESLRQWTLLAVSNDSIYNIHFSEDHWLKLRPFFEKLIDEALESPREGILSDLIWQEQSRGMYSREQLIALAKIMLVGGNETTPNLIGSAALILHQNPHMKEMLAENPELINNLLSETLRHQSPTQMVHRMTTKDAVLSGVAIPAGSLIAVCIGAANRDPQKFPDPDRFDWERGNAKMIPFGYGPHTCPGVHLSKLEAKVGLEAFFARYPQWSLAEPVEQVRYRNSSHVRALEKLEVMV